jgi:restriction endonuclease S subunit
MKDSGVEWLAEIPRRWEMKRLKYLVSEPLRYGANEPAELTDPDLPRYIRITDIRDDGTLRDDTFRSIPDEVAAPHLLSDGDMLFARSGATVGKTFRYDRSWGRAAHAGYLIRARLDERRVMSHFVLYFTQSETYWDWLLSNFIQATIQNVSAERYASLVIPVPSLEEQGDITRELTSAVGRLGGLMRKIQGAIDRLAELRTSLISAAVTGEIDVRGDAA